VQRARSCGGLRVIPRIVAAVNPSLRSFMARSIAQLGILHIGLTESRLACACATSSGREPCSALGQLGFQIGHLPPWPACHCAWYSSSSRRTITWPSCTRVALVDADPLTLADDFGGYFDAMRRHDLSRPREHTPPGALAALMALTRSTVTTGAARVLSEKKKNHPPRPGETTISNPATIQPLGQARGRRSCAGRIDLQGFFRFRIHTF